MLTFGMRPPTFRKSRDGNVTTVFAVSAPMLILAIAVGTAFADAAIVKTKLNAAADAASLAALTPTTMQETDAQAQAAAVAMFTARANAISSLIAGKTQVTVTITHPSGNPGTRIVQVSYSAETNSVMGNVLGASVIGVNGSATAQATTPPNIDFYLLLDNSPSMALPATQAGITQMQKLTPDQGGGCAFACHQASTNNGDTAGNPCSDGTLPTLSNNTYCDTSKGHYQIDNYALARQNGISLRLDELTSGVATLMQTASGYQASGIYVTPPTYRFSAYSMDSTWAIGVNNTQVLALTSDYVNQWSVESPNFGVMEMYSNNVTCGNASCTTGGSQGDIATNYDNAMSDIYNTLPTPGAGTNQPGDKPQEVLFFVTDGVEDEAYGSDSRIQQVINGANGSGVNYCTEIKNKGVKIAILYTEYLAVPSNSWYESYIAPIQSSIGPALEACASPGLYYDAAIGDDLGKDLSTLFNIVTQQASLSN